MIHQAIGISKTQRALLYILILAINYFFCKIECLSGIHMHKSFTIVRSKVNAEANFQQDIKLLHFYSIQLFNNDSPLLL